MYFFHLQNVRFVRVLRPRDRLVRSSRQCIHSLRASIRFAADCVTCCNLPQIDSLATLQKPVAICFQTGLARSSK